MSYIELYKDAEYLSKNPTWHVEESPFKAKYILKLLARHNLSPRTICDVGCGAGEVLKQLQDKMGNGHEFWGYDISPVAQRLIEPRLNEKLHFMLADPSKENAYYDLLLVLDVVEHVEDYLSFLRSMRPIAQHKVFHFPLDLSVQSVIRKNGILKQRLIHAHLHYFNKELAVQALTDTGYEILDYSYLPRSNEIGPSLLQKAFRLPRAALYALHRDFAVRVLGGYSLMILAR